MEKKKEGKDLFSLDYEKDILGCILIKGSDWLATAKALLGKTEVKAFYSPEAQAIYQACLDLEKKGKVIGLPTVHEVLKKKGKGKIDLPFLESLTSYANENEALFEQELRDIRQFALHREAVGTAMMIEGKDFATILQEQKAFVEECQEALSQGKDERPRTLTQDLKDGIPAIAYLVGDGLLPKAGYVMIAGKSKNRKSTLALYFAHCLATKTNVFQGKGGDNRYAFPTIQRGKTLYLFAEGQRGFILGILKRQKEGLEREIIKRTITEEETDLIETKLNQDAKVFLDTDEGVVALERLLKAEHYDLVIIDPLTLFVTGDIDKSQSALKIVRTLETLSHKYGCLFLVVHHGRKDRPEASKDIEVMDNILGSSIFRNNFESGLYLEKRKKGTGAEDETGSLFKKITFEFRNAKTPPPLSVAIDPQSFLPFVVEEKEVMSYAGVDVYKLRDFVNDYFKGEALPNELVNAASKHFDVGTKRIYNVLKEGDLRGVFEKEKKRGGKWRVAKEEEELPF